MAERFRTLTAYHGNVDAFFFVPQNIDPRSLRIELLRVIEAADKLADQTSRAPLGNYGQKLPRHRRSTRFERPKKAQRHIKLCNTRSKATGPSFKRRMRCLDISGKFREDGEATAASHPWSGLGPPSSCRGRSPLDRRSRSEGHPLPRRLPPPRGTPGERASRWIVHP